MKNLSTPLVLIAALVALAAPFGAQAQTTGGSVADDFTGTSTSNPWYFFNGACLTASALTGVEPTTTSGGQVPGCTTIGTSYYNQPLVGGQNGVAGNTQTLPDPNGQGALRFTNGAPGGFSQNGGILSTTPFPTGSGVSITFKTVTYRGNSGGAGGDGADGISFFLMDSSALNTTTITGTSAGDGNGLGSWGGSLGYTCSNANPPYNGLVGAYLGLGIDEYGNFLNGAQLMPGYIGNPATGDNSQLGYGYKPNRIGLRGAGNIAWNWLHANYPTYYPNSFTAAQQNAAVQQTCRNGVVWDYANGNKAAKNNGNTIPIYDYAPIPNAYVELPASTKIANEASMARGGATTIFYQLKITANGLLSLNYALCPPVGGCGAYQSVIQRQSITASNGPLPTSFLFGFAGSTGGATNIHEILCFKADPVTTAASGAGASEKQSAKLETGAQAYFAFYNPSNWTGRVTASTLGLDTFGNVVIAAAPNWDGACTLTGVKAGSSCLTTGVAGPLTAQAPTSRVILTSTGGTGSGIPFEWNSLTTAQQNVLTAGDATPTADRLSYLRGDRTNEINTLGVGEFRPRSSVLADVIDSSPSWVGPPVSPYTVNWQDRLNMSATMPEASSTVQSYQQYVTAQQTRLNVVYVGANDGLLHGFRSGAYNPDGTFNTSSPNDGVEVLAYMPAAVLQSIHSTTANLDYANAQYGHNFFEDATPGTGDVFYNGAWHSWLVGGLGAGGSAIFALDVTNPGPGVPSAGGNSAFTESQSSSLVIGEWNSSNITCVNVSNCGQNLGNTYGTPQLRRLHDGRWAVIFGNGFGSTTGDAGIFVMTLDPTTAAPTFYYFSTGRGSSGNPNGIAFPSPADLDGDHITDYVYAGDLQGNVWRFDLTSASEASWGVSPGPLFYTGGQPIVTALVVASGSPSPGMTPQIMVLFGTGQKNPLTNLQGATYATGTQSLYGVWDWNMAGWNSVSGASYASLANNNPAVPSGGSAGANTLQQANLQQQTVTVNTTTGNRDILTNAAICWAGNCASNGKFGWYLNFPGTQEQVIFSPELVSQALTVNSIVPAQNNPLSCATLNDTGFTYVLSAMTGGAFNQVFLPPSEAANPLVNSDARYTDNAAIALQTNATGSSFITGNSAGTKYLVYETNQVQGGGGAGANNIQGGTLGLNLPPNTTGRRLSWIERR